jgi:hypothetical protein
MKNANGTDLKVYILLCIVLLWAMLLKAENNGDSNSNGLNNVIHRDIVSDIQQTMRSQPYLGRVYPLIFREGKTEAKIADLDQDFSDWKGNIIADINIVQRDVFVISESLKSIPLYLSILRFGNWLQPQTRIKRIKSNLFFAEGDSLNPDYLISNLHYLYDLGLYSELEFDLHETEDNQVRVNLALREKFFILLSAKYVEDDEIRFRILDRNFLGLGNSLIFNWYLNPRDREYLGWESSYTDPNIFGTFIKGDFRYQKQKGKEELELGLLRDFLFPLFRDFGGLDFGYSKSGPPRDSISVQKNEYGAWYARAFSTLDYPHYLYSAVSGQARQHQQRPSGIAWQDAVLGLAALGYAGSEYHYIPGLSSFLDSDYVPMGHFLQAMAGYEFGETRSRPFLGLQAAGAWYGAQGDYLYGQFALDGFLRDGKAEQAFVAFEPVYISPNRTLGQYVGRSLITARAVKSIKALSTQKFKLSDDQFFRDGKDLQGTDILSLGMEEDVNTPFQIFGFQLSAFAFLDLAVVDDDTAQMKSRNSLFSQGLGLRLRNPSLIWDFIEVRLALQFLNSGEPRMAASVNVNPTRILSDFRGRRPKPYLY